MFAVRRKTVLWKGEVSRPSLENFLIFRSSSEVTEEYVFKINKAFQHGTSENYPFEIKITDT